VTIIARHDKVGPNKVLHSEAASPPDQTHMITFGGIARLGRWIVVAAARKLETPESHEDDCIRTGRHES